MDFEKLLNWLINQPIHIVLIVLSLSVLGLFFFKIEKFKDVLALIFKNKRKRSCGDCILLLFHTKEEYLSKRNIVQRNVIPTQKTFAYQKILETEFKLLQAYRDDLSKLRKEEDSDRENKEFIIYSQCLKNALYLVKQELARSFDENGFHDLDDIKFQLYVKNMAKNIINIEEDYMLQAYPSSGMIVPIKYRFDNFPTTYLSDVAFEIYIKAKEIRLDAEEKLKILDQQFKKDIDAIIVI
jgi:hypothetical protein